MDSEELEEKDEGDNESCSHKIIKKGDLSPKTLKKR